MIRKAVTGIALFFAFALVLPGLAQEGDGSTLSESQFLDLIEETRSTANAYTQADQMELTTEELAQIHELGERWQVVRRIQPSQSVPIEASFPYLAQQMMADQPDFQAVVEHLDGLDDWMSNPLVGNEHPQALTSLEEILASSQIDTGDTIDPELVENIGHTLEEWLRKLFPSTHFNIPDVTDLVLAGLGVLVILAAFVFVARTLRSEWVSELALKTDETDEGQELTSQSAIQKAEQRLHSRDIRHAVRYLYLACIIGLNERGVIEFDISSTNREFAASFTQSSSLRKPINHIVEVFDRTWYGYQEISDSQMQTYRRTIEDLLQRAET
jgi:hypothetical protein